MGICTEEEGLTPLGKIFGVVFYTSCYTVLWTVKSIMLFWYAYIGIPVILGACLIVRCFERYNYCKTMQDMITDDWKAIEEWGTVSYWYPDSTPVVLALWCGLTLAGTGFLLGMFYV